MFKWQIGGGSLERRSQFPRNNFSRPTILASTTNSSKDNNFPQNKVENRKYNKSVSKDLKTTEVVKKFSTSRIAEEKHIKQKKITSEKEVVLLDKKSSVKCVKVKYADDNITSNIKYISIEANIRRSEKDNHEWVHDRWR